MKVREELPPDRGPRRVRGRPDDTRVTSSPRESSSSLLPTSPVTGGPDSCPDPSVPVSTGQGTTGPDCAPLPIMVHPVKREDGEVRRVGGCDVLHSRRVPETRGPLFGYARYHGGFGDLTSGGVMTAPGLTTSLPKEEGPVG